MCDLITLYIFKITHEESGEEEGEDHEEGEEAPEDVEGYSEEVHFFSEDEDHEYYGEYGHPDEEP